MPTPTFVPLVDPTAAELIPSLALLGPLLIPATLLAAVVPSLPKGASYIVDASSSSDVDVVDVLNKGASAAVVSPAQLAELAGLPRERLIVKIAEAELASAAALTEAAAGVYVTGVTTVPTAKALGLKADVYAELASATPASVVDAIKAGRPTTLVIPTALLTNAETSSSHLSIADAFLAPITTDRPDGLFASIVASAGHSSRPLGMVYSSRESVAEAIKTQKGVYQSRKHGLWRKGETSGSVQDLVALEVDCDADALVFHVVQHGTGFCHLGTSTCFGNGQWTGLARLEDTLKSRLADAPEGSYTKRIFTDEKLLRAKIMEEAEELCDAQTKEEIAFEAADLLYFALARAVSKGVSLKDIELALDAKGLKVTRRQGDAKPKWEEKVAAAPAAAAPAAPAPAAPAAGPIRMRTTTLKDVGKEDRRKLLLRPVLNSLAMIDKVKPIVERVRTEGDAGLKAMTKQFDRAELSSNVALPPFATPSEDELPPAVRAAIDQAYANVKAFHAAQVDPAPLRVETMPGVVCSRFARPIQRVGIYVPGGTAILPSTAIMLGVPAQVAGCKEIVLATPPRADGSISPEVLYVAKLVGVTCILKAGGAQAVAALAYGTAEVPKVDKIFGPGNQWVTAAKMLVQNDTDALVSIDMPAGPSEVLVIVDSTANPVFVASDLLSQAEHGVDSQVVLVAISLAPELLSAIEAEVDKQARALPRVAIAREAIAKSLIVLVDSQAEGMDFSNEYAPEHLIMHLADAPGAVAEVENAGSVFVGAFSPESCGDYASGTNHTLPTNGYARQFSGVNTLSFQKHITSQEVTKEGLRVLGPVVVTLAEREGLEAHANAVRVRLAELNM
jgi:phosphoribosyl-ATP pyrophosphohydrolase/phosphoribosyl-AMP cyclohydrolase/histidinol dehydrogenase